MTAYTKKPCPACKQVPEWRRRADDVCEECRKLIDEAKAAREVRKGRVERVYWMPFASHGLEYKRDCDEMQHVLYDALPLLGRITADESLKPVGPLFDGQQSASLPAEMIVMDHRVRDFLNAVYAALGKATDKAYDEGHATGESLLLSLAGGNVSLEDFNRRTIGLKANGKARA